MRFFYLFIVLISIAQNISSEIDLSPLSKITLDETEYTVTPESFMKEYRPTHKVYGSNAAKHYLQASKYLNLTEEEYDLISDFLSPDNIDEFDDLEDFEFDDESFKDFFTPKGPVDYQQIIKLENKILNNTKYMDECEAAYNSPNAKWPVLMEKWPPPKEFMPFDLVVPSLGIIMDATNIRSFLSIYAAQKHDKESAYMHLERLEKISEHAKQHNHILINGLVYVTIKTIFFDTASKLMQLNANDGSYIGRVVELVKRNTCKTTDYKPFLLGEKYFCLQGFDDMLEKPHTFYHYMNLMQDYSFDIESQDTSLDEHKIITDFAFVIIPEKSMKENIVHYFKLAEEFDEKESIHEYENKLQVFEDNLPRWDIFSNLFLPQLTKSTSAYVTAHQHQKLFSIAQEIYAYKSHQLEWPNDLKDLRLNEDETFDLFSGNQLIYKSKPEPILYSVGQNRENNQGHLEDDIVLTFNYHAPEQKEEEAPTETKQRRRGR